VDHGLSRELRARLIDPDPEVRAYGLGSSVREANTRDVRVWAARKSPSRLAAAFRSGRTWAEDLSDIWVMDVVRE
jgi:hypothetical protein